MRFEEAYEGWTGGRLTQAEAVGCWGYVSAASAGTWCGMRRTGWRGWWTGGWSRLRVDLHLGCVR